MSDTDNAVMDREIEAEAARLPPLDMGLEKHLPALTDAASAFMPVPLQTIREVAAMVARIPGLPVWLQTPEACEALTLQAALWRISPLFVAQNAYRAKPDGPIGYEAKMLNAVILANGPLSRRPRLSYGYADPTQRTTAQRFCRAQAWVIGEDEPFVVTSPPIARIKVKNSPLWFADPDQQLGYYTLRNMARLHFPDVLGGAYTREEIVLLKAEGDLERKRLVNRFDDDAQDAEFEDHPPVTENEAQAHQRAQNKADGKQDSRDPRDAPQNQTFGEEEGPPDLGDLRTWAAGEQRRILALKSADEMVAAGTALSQEKRFTRLKAYDQTIAQTILASIRAKVAELRG